MKSIKKVGVVLDYVLIKIKVTFHYYIRIEWFLNWLTGIRICINIRIRIEYQIE